MTRRPLLATLLVSALCMGAACSAPPAPSASREPIRTKAAGRVAPQAEPQQPVLGRFRYLRAMRHIRHLAEDIGVRVRTTTGETRGARYVARKLRNYGYQVHFQKFSVDGGTSRNVVARWPGANRYGYVVGGHMDTVPGSPGANDNASGTAVVLELAKIAAGTKQAQFITFVGFGSEEYGENGEHHIGSEVFVERLGPRGRRRLPGMTSIDMVADGRPLLVGNSGIADDIVARTLYRKVRDANIAADYHVLCDCSDHGPFEHAGIPASFMYSGEEPDYHSPSDTVANLQPRDVRRTGRAARAFIKDLSRRVIRRFRSH